MVSTLRISLVPTSLTKIWLVKATGSICSGWVTGIHVDGKRSTNMPAARLARSVASRFSLDLEQGSSDPQPMAVGNSLRNAIAVPMPIPFSSPYGLCLEIRFGEKSAFQYTVRVSSTPQAHVLNASSTARRHFSVLTVSISGEKTSRSQDTRPWNRRAYTTIP
jgi:hypothetical protein